MGSIVREAQLDVSAETAWEVLDRYTRSELHVFSTCHSERQVGDCRVVTNALDGAEIWERNVTVDPVRRRAVYAIPGFPGAEHHQAEMRVFRADSGSATLVWTTDLLPDSLVPLLAPHYDVMFEDLCTVINAYTADEPVSA